MAREPRAQVSGAPAAPERTRWGAVFLLFAGGVVCGAFIGKAPLALPAIRAELAMSLPAAGWLLSLINIVGMATGMAAGSLGDRFGHRPMVLASLAILALASVLGAMASGPPLLMFGRFLEGVGFIGAVASLPVLLLRVTRPQDRRFVLGLWSSYYPVGMAIMILASPVLMAPAGWRGLWLANGALAAAVALVLAGPTRALARPTPEEAAAPKTTPWAGMARTLASPGPLLLALAFAAYAGVFLAVFGFLPTLLVEDRGMSAADAALLTAIAVAFNAAGNVAGGWLLQRGVARWLLIAAAFMVMAACGWGVYSDALGDGVRFAQFSLLSLCGGVIPASCFAGAPVHAPTPALVATTNGLIVQGANLGQAVMPPVMAAAVAAWGGWHAAPTVVGATCAVGLAIAFFIGRLERPGRLTSPRATG